MKVWKKNMVAAAVLVTVCAGIYVNWLQTEQNASASLLDTLDAEKVMSEDMLILEGDMAAIAAGEADLAIGTERISRQIEGLDFIPLLEERFDFVIKKEMVETEAVQKLLTVLRSPAFRREVAHFSGNDYRDLGKIICEV